jgi:hypothetical protein
MVRFGWLLFGALLILAPASPSAAVVVEIEKTAPVRDHTEVALRAALEAAVAAAITEAVAMGLPWVRMSHARFPETAVAVRILATDADPAAETQEDARGPDTGSGPRTDRDHPRAGS